jgi:N-acetylglucosaminyl-diphospho-decaprenol L-rhamnosyltransferase
MAAARIVIVNFNAGENLHRCMPALSAQTRIDFEVRIVDNASTDGSLRYVPDDDRFLVIHAGSNVGFAAGCNLGARDCAAPFIVFLNPDAFPEPGWLEAVLRAAQCHPDAAMFGSLQLSATHGNIIDGAGDCYSCFGVPWRGGYGQPVTPLPDYGEAFSPCGAAAMYRTEWFARVGGFDESFFCYLEDIDLAFRIRLLGGRCMQVNSAIVRHVGSATSGTVSDFTMYHSARNRFWTIIKNVPGWLLCVVAPLHIAFIAYLLVRFGRSSTASAIRQGLLAGFAGLPGACKQRRKIQAARTASIGDIARAINWSIPALRKRKIILRAWQKRVQVT